MIFNSIFTKRIKFDIADNYINKVLWPNALFIIFGFAIDCAASGVIPLLSVIQGADYDYKDFGLKTFHVFYMGYMSAFSIVCFERYLATKNKKFFWYSMFGIAVTVLIVSRGAMLLLLIPMALLFLSQKKIKIIRGGGGGG
ncbi:hypothetical protein ABK905_17850 [Acerihabitans sp. KWT182]|uniref:MFS transporter n=1 Tax=Acerihabitans sp. KWT182 TaxID=3157919 RepID=A0AAU7Q671_9GAMM